MYSLCRGNIKVERGKKQEQPREVPIVIEVISNMFPQISPLVQFLCDQYIKYTSPPEGLY